jgi:hypothetical protein
MKTRQIRMVLNVTALMLLSFSLNTSAEYIEGIDTTDENGYGLDSTFRITNDSLRFINVLKVTIFGGVAPDVVTGGLFNYTFEDIHVAPRDEYSHSFNPMGGLNLYQCFTIKKKDSAYAKAQVNRKLPSNRYEYKYGKNSSPNNRLLIADDYDRTVRYKPNCVFYKHRYMGVDSICWEPPLPSNNNLIGYSFYRQKPDEIIDTSLPIDMAQWNSTSITDTIVRSYPFSVGNYSFFNVVAVYDNGKSDFLKGWTYFFAGFEDGIVLQTSGLEKQKAVKIQVSPHNVLFLFPSFTLPGGANLTIFSQTGRIAARITGIKENRYLWSLPSDFANGLYLLRAEFPDRSVITQPFTVTR